jgi:hypothetical protein
VKRVCENKKCLGTFLVPWDRRGQSFCSLSCGNTKEESIVKRTISKRKTSDEKAKQNFHQQVMIYKNLLKTMDKVEKKDWENACRIAKISFRFQTNTPNPFIAKNWKDFKQRATEYNHRVSYVEELPGLHTVYNITVENQHTLFIATRRQRDEQSLMGIGTMQCAEQSLARGETCCLAELYLPNISSKEELFTCAKYLYRINKHALTLPCYDSEKTEDIVHKNMRMGIGITGFCQATDEQKEWLPSCYTYLRDFDKYYSKRHKFPESIKLTTVKPSGSLSLLAGTTSGVHPGFSRYYIRRIRVSSQSPLVQLAIKFGYDVEYVRNFDGTLKRDTQIISFPYTLPEHTILADNCSAIQQLENSKWLQQYWSDNSVSITVYYKKEELPAIKDWLRENYNDNVKTVSFLLHSEHGFDQAPLEQITKEQYDEMMTKCKPFDSVEGVCYFTEEDENLNLCDNGHCPIR